MDQLLTWLIEQFERRELVYENIEDEALKSGFRVDTASGQEATFPLIAFPFEDLAGNTFVRLSITPFVDLEGGNLPAEMAERIASLNHELGWVRMVIDPDGDLEFCGEIPVDLLSDTSFDLLLQTLVSYAANIYDPVVELIQSQAFDDSVSLEDLARIFVEQYGEEIVLDYTIASLALFEEIVDDEYRAFLREEDALDANVHAYGAYIGEVLVREGDGYWEEQELFEDSRVAVRERHYQPVRMARAYLESERALRPSHIVRRALAQ
jgi:hypothetical protein